MRLATERIRKLTALATGAAVVTGLAPAVQGTTCNTAVTVDSVSVEGEIVGITLWNVSDETQSGVVWVQVHLVHGLAQASSAFVVTGGQKVFVRLCLPSPVQGVVQVGTVLDDGAPF